MAHRLQSEVKRVAEEGASVLLSSHILAEVEEVADRISIIRKGRRVESGSLDEFRHLTRTEYTIPGRLPAECAHRVRRLTSAWSEANGQTRFAVEPARTADVLAVLAEAGVTDLSAQPPSLEELFIRQYGDGPSAGTVDGPNGVTTR